MGAPALLKNPGAQPSRLFPAGVPPTGERTSNSPISVRRARTSSRRDAENRTRDACAPQLHPGAFVVGGGGGAFGALHFYKERDAHFVAVIDGDVDGVLARLIELELLDVDDEIADEKICVRGDRNIDGHIDAGHDKATVFIHEIHFHFV